MWDVTRSTTLARLLYACPAWRGYADMGHKHRLHNFLLKLQRFGFLPHNVPSYAEMCDAAVDKLFASVLCNKNHVLAQLGLQSKKLPTYFAHVLTIDLYLMLIKSCEKISNFSSKCYKKSHSDLQITVTKERI